MPFLSLRKTKCKTINDVVGIKTIQIIRNVTFAETSMGIKLDTETSIAGRQYKEGIYTLGKSIVFRAQRVWMYPNWLFAWSATGRKQQKTLDLLSSFRDNVINKRRDTSDFQNMYINVEQYDNEHYNGKKRLAMLDLLLQVEKEGAIDAKGIGEEVDTFMFEVCTTYYL